jgi:hypothetical protein
MRMSSYADPTLVDSRFSIADVLLVRRSSFGWEGKLYRSRKADVAPRRKLPELRNSKVVTLSELIDDVLEFIAASISLR